MSRVSFAQSVANSVEYSRINTNRLFDLQRQLATGKKIEYASEDPAAAARSQRLQTKIRRDEQQIRNIETNEVRIAEAETHMQSVIEQLQRIRTLSLQAVNAPYTTADMSHIATEINQQLEAMVRVGNARSAGSSVFAGAETSSDAFTVTRNAEGEITGVTYNGDAVELEIDAQGNVPMTWPGDVVFAAGPMSRRTTATTWDGSTVSHHADREISAVMIPSSGVIEGSLRVNGALVNYDLDGDPTGGEGDSLLDLAEKINDVDAGVTARVRGTVAATAGVGVPGNPVRDFATEFGGFTAGTFNLNGSSITVTAADTIFTLANRVNAVSSATHVTAEVYDANGNLVDGTPAAGSAATPLTLRLSGGLEVSDAAAGSTNVMQLLGFTNGAASGQNLTGNVIDPYRLELTGNMPGPFTLEDASGSLAADLGLLSNAGQTAGGLVFETLVDLRDRLRAGDATTIRSTLLPEIDASLAAVEVSRAEAGVRTIHLERQRERITEIVITQKSLLSDVEDADLTEVISDLKLQETTQSAALKATADLLRLSLLNFL